MDISLMQHLIFDWFREHDSFEPTSQYKRLSWDTLGEEKHDEEECQLALAACLEEMSSEGFVRKIDSGSGKNKKTTYIISQSMKDSPTELYLSKQTSKNVMSVVAGVLPMLSLDYEFNPKSEVSENEIILLLEVINILSSQLQQEIEKSKSLPKPSGNNNELTSGD